MTAAAPLATSPRRPFVPSAKSSITWIVALALVTITTVLMGVFLVYSRLADRQQQMLALRHSLEFNADQTAEALYLPVYRLDVEQLEKVLGSVMRDPEVAGVELQRTDGAKVRYVRWRDASDNVTVVSAPAGPELLKEERTIYAKSRDPAKAPEPIGVLTIFGTPKLMQARLRENFMRLVVFMVLIDVTLILCLYGLLWHVVLRPLKAIEQFAVEVQDGMRTRVHRRAGGTFYGELQSLCMSLENMVALLASRYAAIQKNETMLTAVLDSVPQAIFWKDSKLVYLGCNKKFVSATGLQRIEQVVGKTDFDFPWPRAEAEAYRAWDAEVLKGESLQQLVEPLRQADGKRLWIETTKLPLVDGDGKVYAILGLFQDITARLDADASLRRQAAFDAMARQILAGLVGSAAVNLDAHLRGSLQRIAGFMGSQYIYIAEESGEAGDWARTHAWCETRLAERGPVLADISVGGGAAFGKHLAAGDTVVVRDLNDLPDEDSAFRGQCAAAGFHSSMQVPLRGSAGRVRGCVGLFSAAQPAEWTAEDIQRITFLCDAIASTLDRIQAEKGLQESETRFRSLIEQAPVAVALSRNGIYEYRNPENLRIFGVPASDANKRAPVLERIAPDCRADMTDVIRRNATGLPVAFPHETRGLRPDGVEFPLMFDVTEVQFPDGPITISFTTDLTERKRTEALMLESEKLRSVAGLAAGVAHEINNPLAAMVQNAQVAIGRLSDSSPANLAAADRHGLSLDALKKYMSDREIPETLEAIRVSGRQASRIVQNLLAYSRRDVPNSVVNLAQLIDQTLELAASDYELKNPDALATVIIEREDAPEGVCAVCHANQIQQVLINLIRNAVQSMRENPPARPRILRLRTFNKGESACVAVEDNGPGLSPEIRGRMFEPFVTTKASGTGLGLFVSYHIVTVNHGGTIGFESTAERGTVCTISLPRTRVAEGRG